MELLQSVLKADAELTLNVRPIDRYVRESEEWEGVIYSPKLGTEGASLRLVIEAGPCPDRETLAVMLMDRWDKATEG